MQALGLRSASLSPSQFAIPASGPAFTVPRGECAYIGLINIVYYRLPPGSPSQQGAAASRQAHGKQAYFPYLKAGGLPPDTATVTLLPSIRRPAGSHACSTRRARLTGLSTRTPPARSPHPAWLIAAAIPGLEPAELA